MRLTTGLPCGLGLLLATSSVQAKLFDFSNSSNLTKAMQSTDMLGFSSISTLNRTASIWGTIPSQKLTQVLSTPEPSTYALLLIGVLGLVFIRRKRLNLK